MAASLIWFCKRNFNSVFILLIIICINDLCNPVVSDSIVKSLPGFSGSLPFKLETGYISVDENEDVEYFYYFVESEGNSIEDPIMFWFTGGPGCSSLCGLAFEIGPIQFNMVEYNGSLPTLVLNPHSWTKVSSIIFIDAPVGTGFSYAKSSRGARTGDLAFANRSFNFLRKWLSEHPEFMKNPLYLGGDSFAGMVVPIVAEEVAKSIEVNDTPKFNFKGYILGNPGTAPEFDENSKVPFAHRMALISDELYESVKKNCEREYRGSHDDNVPCSKDLEAVSICTTRMSMGHILEPKCQSVFSSNNTIKENRKLLLEKPSQPNLKPSLFFGDPPPEFPKFGCRNYENLLIYFWANDKTVQRALHIKKGTLKTWLRCNLEIPYTRQVESVVGYHKRLNSRQHYRALIYSGDHDLMIPYIGTQAWIKSLKFPIVSQWRPWLVDDQTAGYVTEYARGFTFATVKGGGHTAPEFKPKECFAMFQRWISNVPL